MKSETKWPPWLIFVDRAPDDNTFLRLMLLNPENDAMSVFVNQVIEADPDGYAPRSRDLNTARRTMNDEG